MGRKSAADLGQADQQATGSKSGRTLVPRGMMDIPSDIKGVLLMERAVKWWAGENPGAPAKVYGAVLIALDGLATEVGLVVEHEISTLVKRLDRLVSEVDESKVVIQYPYLLRNVEDSQANKNTPTWWDLTMRWQRQATRWQRVLYSWATSRRD